MYICLSKTFIIMSFALKSCPITSSNVALNDLHDKLNNTIKNKLYNINNQEMDNSTCSTCADSSDLNNLDSDNLDSHLNNLGLMFYKNMDYKQKNNITILMFMLLQI